MSSKTPIIQAILSLPKSRRDRALDALHDATVSTRAAAAVITEQLRGAGRISSTRVHELRKAIEAGADVPRPTVGAAGTIAPSAIVSARTTVRETPKGTTTTTAYVLREDRSDVDLGAMSQRARELVASRTERLSGASTGSTRRTAVVVIGDAQLGKVDALGGTPETLARIYDLVEQAALHAASRGVERVILVDAGDIVEGVESAGGKGIATNDLSPMQQVDAAGVMMLDAAERLERIAPVTYVAVPSNHAAFRRGGVTYGNPATDDWGIVVAQRISDFARRTDRRIGVVTPDAQLREEAVQVEVYGERLAVVHGHQTSGPAGIKRLAAGHALNDGPLHGAALVVTGHYRHLTLSPMGRTASGRQGWHVQAPALDNGSSWFANLGGDVSDPGLAYIEMTPGGVDVSSLQLFSVADELARPRPAAHVVI